LLYTRYLKQKNIRYTGLDINPGFVERVIAKGGESAVWDMRKDKPLPEADYVIMQASLYHFLTNVTPLVDKLIAEARKNVFVTEPVKNLSDSPNKWVAWLAKHAANPGTHHQFHRFNETTLAKAFQPYHEKDLVEEVISIAGGREKLYVLKGMCSSKSLQSAATTHQLEMTLPNR
jgi:hypothetical protein